MELSRCCLVLLTVWLLDAGEVGGANLSDVASQLRDILAGLGGDSNSAIETTPTNAAEDTEHARQRSGATENDPFTQSLEASLASIELRTAALENYFSTLDRLDHELKQKVTHGAEDMNTNSDTLDRRTNMSWDKINELATLANVMNKQMINFETQNYGQISQLDREIAQTKEDAWRRRALARHVIQYGGIGSGCTGAKDCVTDGSVCRANRCQCQVGLGYDGDGRTCVEKCEGYGRTYQSVTGYAIRGHNNIVASNKTSSACKQLCEQASEFVCRSIDYFPSYRKCYISNVTKIEVPGTSWERNRIAVHYQRDCA